MPSPDANGRPLRAAIARFAVWMAFAFCLFQSITVTERWWSGELSDPGLWEWLWIALLPVLVGVYLRHFSVLGCERGCAAGRRGAD